jgi:predicted butyrate kinase (DUF1464 family)
MLALGIASTPAGWHLALWDEHRAARLRTVAQTDELWAVLRDLLDSAPAMPVVLPSGLGIPVTRAGDLLDQDIAEMTGGLAPDQAERIGAVLVEARRRLPRALCIPAVKQLPTIPLHRKLGRPDLGGADAVCLAAWILSCRRHAGAEQDGADFLLLHRNQTGRVILAVQNGRIVDGIGAQIPGLQPPGTPGQGDAPRTPWERRTAFRARDPLTLRDAEQRLPGCRQCAHDEALCKEVLGLAALYGLQDVLLLGDDLAALRRTLEARMRPALAPEAVSHEAALGAALIAAGLTGGPTAGLVDRLGIREARERAPDWIEP